MQENAQCDRASWPFVDKFNVKVETDVRTSFLPRKHWKDGKNPEKCFTVTEKKKKKDRMILLAERVRISEIVVICESPFLECSENNTLLYPIQNQ